MSNEWGMVTGLGVLVLAVVYVLCFWDDPAERRFRRAVEEYERERGGES